MESLLPYAIFGGGAIVFIAIFMMGYRHYKNQLEERNRLLVEFGFSGMEKMPPDLAEQLRQLRNYKQVRRFKHIFRRSRSDFDLYLFDTVEKGDSDNTSMNMTAVSERLNIPRFSLYPRFGGDNFLLKMAFSVLETAVRKIYKAQKVHLPDHIAKKYYMVAENPDDLREFVKSPAFQRLVSSPDFYYIEGNRRVFQTGRAIRNRAGKSWKFDRNKLTRMIQDNETVFQVLAESFADHRRQTEYRY